MYCTIHYKHQVPFNILVLFFFNLFVKKLGITFRQGRNSDLQKI